jgi:hypothetical protein
MTFTTSRHELAAYYSSAGITTYPSAPATLVTPCVVILPDSPWIEPNRVGDKIRARMSFTVTAYASAIDNELSLAGVEALVEAIIRATPHGLLITSVGRPVETDQGSQGVTLSAAVNISAQIEEG